jgi:ferredoxin
MAYMISEDCISCGACESECPNQAISEGETSYRIDPNKCTQCVGSFTTQQCADICPVSACVPNSDKVETQEQLLAKWQEMHPGEEPRAED